jgi:predicted deacylase
MEVGGGGRRPAAEVALVVNALRGVLAAAGSIEAPAEAAGEPSLTLSGGAQLRSSVAGVVVQSVEVGQMVESGQMLCTVTDFDGEVLETVNSPHSGRVLLRALARVVTEGALLATVGWVDD